MPAVVVSGSVGGEVASVVWQAVKPTVTASGSAVGYPAINVTDPNTWNGWKASGANGSVVFDLGVATAVDGIGIAAHELFSSGVTTVTLASSPDNTAWTNRASYTPVSDADLFFLLPSVTARYWRVMLTGPAALIGIIQVGKRLIFPHAPLDDYTPLNHAREYEKLRNDSLKNQWLSNRVIAAGAANSVDMGYMERTWVDTNIPAFKSHYDQAGTFFYAGCPSKYPLDMGYCRADGDGDTISIAYVEADRLATVSFSLRSYVPQ